MGWLIRLNEVPNETSMRTSANGCGAGCMASAIDVPIKGWYINYSYINHIYIYIKNILDHEISSSVFIAVLSVFGSPPFTDT